MHFIDYLDSPLGTLEIQASELGITQVIFCGSQHQAMNANALTARCKTQLQQYFNHQRQDFQLPLDLQGSLFQQSIWACLTQIPFGTSRSYLDIAKMIGNPNAVRAVGGANGRNPISIIVPCHRVISSSGKLTGYAGGIERKLWLLKHEGIAVKQTADISQLNNTISSRQQKTEFLS
ncbi:MAG: methylated-DNA--[protein]-cysteine S-methyltransferase [Gammaproteobacteria bacterium]|nr:methylated-DNA--[protein]-cysteine S-methyltransferase [Gammaproteobacteria bacterium]